MLTPSDLQTHLETVYAALPKMAVLINTYSNKKHLVTRCSKVVKFFQGEKYEKKYFESSLDTTEFECYELRYDKYVKIAIEDVHYLEFLGIPSEIPPPLYLNPKINAVSDDQLYDLQLPSLIEIKQLRDEGCFIEIPYDEERELKLLSIKNFITTKLELPLDSHLSFRIFKNPLLNNLLLYSDIKDGDIVINLSEKLYFMPAILACLEDVSNKNNTEKIIEFINSEIDIKNLKSKWIATLESYRKKYLSSLEEEVTGITEHYKTELIGKLTVAQLQKIVHDTTCNPNIKLISDNEGTEKYIGCVNKVIDAAMLMLNDDQKPAESLILAAEELSHLLLPSADYVVGVRDAIAGVISITVSRYQKIKEQYTFLITEVTELDFQNEISEINDYRLYLRYWPNAFLSRLPFHDVIRPLSTVEHQVIKALLREGIEIEYEKIFDLYINEMDCYHSVLDGLEDKTELMREKKLEQIKIVAQERIQEIKAEMDYLYEDLSEEEQFMFNNMLEELGNIEKYKEELAAEPHLIDVLMYWPLSLYPKPANIVQP